MAPTIKPGDQLEWIPLKENADVKRFSIVLFKPPFDTNALFAFRVVGFPAESIAFPSHTLAIDGKIVVQEELPTVLRGKRIPLPASSSSTNVWVLKANEIFVLGDNLTNAYDSRFWGPLPTSNLVGLVVKIHPSSDSRSERPASR